MKCYLFDSQKTDGKRIFAIHLLLFHGMLLRGPGRRVLGRQTPFLGVTATDDAELEINAFNLSEVLMPTASPLVVSNRLAQAITSALPNTGFLPSHIAKVVNVPYELGDIELVYQLRTAEIENRWWKRLPHDEAAAVKVDGYGELRMPRYMDLDGLGGKRAKVRASCPSEEMFGPFEATLSEELLALYPITWHMNGLIMSEKAMELFSPELDSRFYWWVEINI